MNIKDLDNFLDWLYNEYCKTGIDFLDNEHIKVVKRHLQKLFYKSKQNEEIDIDFDNIYDNFLMEISDDKNWQNDGVKIGNYVYKTAGNAIKSFIQSEINKSISQSKQEILDRVEKEVIKTIESKKEYRTGKPLKNELYDCDCGYGYDECCCSENMLIEEIIVEQLQKLTQLRQSNNLLGEKKWITIPKLI